uniref:Uncharacterized protein n=1 Tax=Arundo donax TaxID=35708 RepID=A0A0A8YZH4_ARUDO
MEGGSRRRSSTAKAEERWAK